MLVPDGQTLQGARLGVMQPARRRAHALPILRLFPAAALGIVGCASPGPPRPPSLHLPRPAPDVTATRSGDQVTLRFNLSSLSTDGQPLRATSLSGSLCRQMAGAAACLPVDLDQTSLPLLLPKANSPATVTWTDSLPAALLGGSPRLIAYRIELRNSSGHSAGPSDPIYAAAGSAPPPISQLRADPMRLGIALHWTPLPGSGEVLLDRIAPVTGPTSPEELTGETPSAAAASRPALGKGGKHGKATSLGAKKSRAAAGTPGLMELQAAPGDSSPRYTIDGTVAEGVPYRYTAFRRQTVQLGGRTLELRSAPSAPVAALWRDIYPPATPLGLTALGYKVPGPDKAAETAEDHVFAVDLVWQPVNDPRLAGYHVYRQTLGGGSTPVGRRELLAAAPVPTPGFHDGTAVASENYRYSVTAVDPRGNESAPAQADVTASATPGPPKSSFVIP